MKERLIYETPEAYWVCERQEDGSWQTGQKNCPLCLVEYLPRDRADEAGAVFMGRVNRIMKSLDCAFVDLGRKRDGFLPLRENSRSFTGGPLRSGDLIPVQIRKEETGEKGAFLSRDLSLAGNLVILMPLNRFVGVSRKITDPEKAEALKAIGNRIVADPAPASASASASAAPPCDETCSPADSAPDSAPAPAAFGLVLREAACFASESEIRRETAELLARWQALRRGIRAAEKPGLLRADSLLSQLRNDYDHNGPLRIETVETVPEALRAQLKTASARKVELPGGGNLVIDRCEAMTVIDVNSARDSSGSEKEPAVTEVNLAACEAIVRQVRLRNLGGIILVDFIDMDAPEDRERVAARLGELFRADRMKTVLHGWTNLGLMEITRRRYRKELNP
ncbi:MAG: ribonuclease E/G [Clostridia bacterium]|nr:ribonuclease E/G [Clostridia bacterium]